MRQFDVFVFDENYDKAQGKLPQPPFTDPELGWFFTSDWNKHLDEIEGEWVIFAHPSIKINRNFLNNVAEVTDSFPMVDAFAPRIRTDKGNFLGGYLLKPAAKGSGFVEIDENAPLRYVAAPHPFLAVFSRRIIQRTGGFDTTLPEYARLADFTLRMMHAGGKMFSVPYLVAQATNEEAETVVSNASSEKACGLMGVRDLKSTVIVLSKAFGTEASVPFALHHPSVILTLLSNRKQRKEKRKAATLLSKLKADFLKEVTAK
ncbi:hypothetical protein SAMN06298224_0123 [Fibrobacter sp. UWB16]|uniref:hypothetical protein n=1 Tax=Fibrobacter sp. UWB16 TaxID=1945874 RepID=UPI000BCBE30C|nr:hypothetical protein [Fibrobacter sp. UWB16]SOD11345.1 hypothetical protein SAMN06298224_0123 [Fibrobacter sp. UWB16]